MADEIDARGLYDVGAIARRVQSDFGIFAPRADAIPKASMRQPRNTCTPSHLRRLLTDLATLTDAIRERRRVVTITDAADEIIDRDLLRWRGRLGAYEHAVDAAIAAGKGEDRSAVLWTVTAPLLIGFYGGEASKLPQQTLDAVTPFVLANMLETSEGWRSERATLFWADLEAGAKDVVDTVKAGLGALPIVLGLGLGLALVVVVARR